jgi:hypothetical protein
MCWIFLNGLNRRQNHGRAQGFRSFEVSGQGSAFLLPSLFCSPALFPSRRPSVTEHILSTVFTVVRFLAYPIPTYHNATCLSSLQCTQTHTTEPNPLPSFVIFHDPFLPLVTPPRCLGLYLAHPFSPPSLLVHICCNPSCSSFCQSPLYPSVRACFDARIVLPCLRLPASSFYSSYEMISCESRLLV